MRDVANEPDGEWLPFGVGIGVGADLDRLRGRGNAQLLPAWDTEETPLPSLAAGEEHVRGCAWTHPLRHGPPRGALLEDAEGVAVTVGECAQPGLLHARRQSDDPASRGHPQRATDGDDGAHGALLLTVQVDVADRGGGLRKATTRERG